MTNFFLKNLTVKKIFIPHRLVVATLYELTAAPQGYELFELLLCKSDIINLHYYLNMNQFAEPYHYFWDTTEKAGFRNKKICLTSQ